jgi:hypothetical protein
MDLITKIMAVLWAIIEKNKDWKVNVATIDNKLTVNILRGKRRNTISDTDGNIVLLKLQQFALN